MQIYPFFFGVYAFKKVSAFHALLQWTEYYTIFLLWCKALRVKTDMWALEGKKTQSKVTALHHSATSLLIFVFICSTSYWEGCCRLEQLLLVICFSCAFISSSWYMVRLLFIYFLSKVPSMRVMSSCGSSLLSWSF